MGDRRIPLEGLETYLHCPRRYEFAVVRGLALEGRDEPAIRRFELLRAAIADALRTDPSDAGALERAIHERIAKRWADHGEQFHSLAQRRHERRTLEATASAYAESVGGDHAAGLARVRSAADDEVIGPTLPVSATFRLPDGSPIDVDAAVDYVYGDGSALVGVRFVPTLGPLGPLRYRSAWEGDVAALFADHFDPDAERFEPGAVGALLETAVVLQGLRGLRDRLDLEPYRTCRYVLLPLADRSNTSVDPVRGVVSTTVEPVDLTEVYVDHHTFGMTHEHRNATVDDRLVEVLAAVESGEFDPSTAWDRIAERSCPDCDYAVCCEERIAAEVCFDG